MKTTSNPKLTTPRTKLGAIGWLYPDNGYPSLSGFVANKVLKFAESPAIMEVSLSFSYSSPLSDVLKAFQGDSYRPLPCLVNNMATYIMEHPRQDTVFSSANRFQPSSCRASALCLKLLSFLEKMASYMLSLSPLEIKTVRASGKISSANIYSDNTDGNDWLNLLFNGQAEINTPFSHIKNNFCFPVPPVQIPSVIIRKDDGQVKPGANNRDGCLIVLQLEGGTMKMEGTAVKVDKLPTPLRITVCPANLAYCFADEPSGKRAFCSNLGISQAIKSISAEGLMTEGNKSDFIESLIIGRKRAEESKPLIRTRLQLEFKGFLSQHKLILAN